MTSGTPKERGGGDFAVPLGASTRGRLRFTDGAHWVVIRAVMHLEDLCRAWFVGRVPEIRTRDGVVIIRYLPFPAGDWPRYSPEHPSEVALNASIPWDIEVHGGASRLAADLRALSLGSLSLDGGVSRLEVTLPAPSGTVATRILGGASNVTIYCLAGAAVRLRVAGGATNLTFGDRHIGATGSALDLRDDDYDDASGRYDLTVTGGSDNLTVVRQPDLHGRDLEPSR